jgi:hypothetical protein
MRKNARQSNFSLGENSVFQNETSSNTTYTAAQFINRDKNLTISDGARAVNFAVGTDKPDYITTTMRDARIFDQEVLSQKISEEDKRKAQDERVVKARSAQFSYGHHPTNYKSTAR